MYSVAVTTILFDVEGESETATDDEEFALGNGIGKIEACPDPDADAVANGNSSCPSWRRRYAAWTSTALESARIIFENMLDFGRRMTLS